MTCTGSGLAEISAERVVASNYKLETFFPPAVCVCICALFFMNEYKHRLCRGSVNRATYLEVFLFLQQAWQRLLRVETLPQQRTQFPR